MKNKIDLENLRLSEIGTKVAIEKTKLPRHKSGELFLKGPIPKKWLEKAGQQGGKALHVAIELWFWAGVKKTNVIKLSISKLLRTGVKQSSAVRGLAALERAGLVSVERHAGRKPIVTILECRENKETENG
jgi:DNA-binding transcriptional ArsR family regulator